MKSWLYALEAGFLQEHPISQKLPTPRIENPESLK